MSRLLHLWYRCPVFFWPLRPLSWLFAFIIWARRKSYALGLLKTYDIPVPVIVVGNLEVGGSGKTPFVIALVKALQAKGYNPGVVSKGYGREESHVKEVLSDNAVKGVGDEALLIKYQTLCPVFVGKSRVKAAKALLDAHACDVVVSDDGLQHYALQRDIVIALDCVDPTCKNHALLPSGPYREPRARFAAMDFHLKHGVGFDDIVFEMGDPYALLSGEVKPWSQWQGQFCYALAGIAKPERFYQGLLAHGVEVEALHVGDHGVIKAQNLAEVPKDAMILMTEKDALKYQASTSLFGQRLVWVVPFTGMICPEKLQAILEKLRDCAR